MIAKTETLTDAQRTMLISKIKNSNLTHAERVKLLNVIDVKLPWAQHEIVIRVEGPVGMKMKTSGNSYYEYNAQGVSQAVKNALFEGNTPAFIDVTVLQPKEVTPHYDAPTSRQELTTIKSQRKTNLKTAAKNIAAEEPKPAIPKKRVAKKVAKKLPDRKATSASAKPAAATAKSTMNWS